MDFSKYWAKEDKTIEEHWLDLLAALEILWQLGYIKDPYIYKLLKVACICHDYGKINKHFADRIAKKTKFNPEEELAHNVLSIFVMEKFRERIIQEHDLTAEDYYRVCFAVLNHHHYCNNIEVITNEYEKAVNILHEFGVEKVSGKLLNNINKMQYDSTTTLIKGLLNKCDYIASAGDVSKIEYENNFLESGMDNLLNSWRSKNSNSNWNDMQLFCKEHRDENIIVVAQTGMGKTEASLHWLGNNKGFYVLPLKVAINAIYKRIKEDVLENQDIENKVALLHSDALSYHLQQQDKNKEKNINQEMDILEYYKQSRQLALPITVSTPDQLFNFVFKYPGYELKLATLSYSKVIVDEIQMYNAELLAYLIKGIQKVVQFGGKVAIITATLAPFIKTWLANTGVEFVEAEFVNDQQRHNLKTYDSKLDIEVIYEKYMEHEQNATSNKTLIIFNTVKKAQEAYKYFKEEKQLANVHLLHSKFIKKDRDALETAILADGRSNVQKSVIWIATQIVEASLDIDFDYLFTELSDINGLFQRLGRCNRKGLKSVEQANCFVFLQTDSNLLITADNAQKGFIDKRIYDLSREALQGIEGVLTERDKIELINSKLTLENIQGSKNYPSAYKIAYEQFETYLDGLYPYEVKGDDARLRHIISYPIIPQCVYNENREEIANCVEIIKSSKDILSKIAAKDKINQYVVNVGRYDLGDHKDWIHLSKYESIRVMGGEYSSEAGFKRSKSNKHFDLGDNFM